MGQSVTMRLASPAATEAHGAALGRCWQAAGVARLLVGLRGDLGAGKTTWARGLLRGLGFTGSVRSPTYTLVEPYRHNALWIVHADLYRVSDDTELAPLGLDEWLEVEPCWVLVEWPERSAILSGLLDLSLEFELLPDARKVRVVSQTARGAAALRAATEVLKKLKDPSVSA